MMVRRREEDSRVPIPTTTRIAGSMKPRERLLRTRRALNVCFTASICSRRQLEGRARDLCPGSLPEPYNAKSLVVDVEQVQDYPFPQFLQPGPQTPAGKLLGLPNRHQSRLQHCNTHYEEDKLPQFHVSFITQNKPVILTYVNHAKKSTNLVGSWVRADLANWIRSALAHETGGHQDASRFILGFALVSFRE